MANNRIISGLIWKFSERLGIQLGYLGIQIVLARILIPDDYGKIAIVTVFTLLADIFIKSGFTQALIIQPNIDDIEYSTVFCFSLFVSILLYILLFFIAPIVSNFYEYPTLTQIMRVQSIIVFFGSFNSIQTTYLQKTMQFRKNFIRSIGYIITYGAVGIFLAIAGYGVWTLVYAQIVSVLVGTIILWVSSDWKPNWYFSFSVLKKLFPFGSRLLIIEFFDVFFRNIYSITIGKFYSSRDLGFYNRGQSIPNMISSSINSPLASVMYPAFSKINSDITAVQSMLRKALKVSSFVVFPLMVGLAAIASNLTIVLLTEKWLSSVVFTQFSCITFGLLPIQTANIQAIKSIGRSDIYLFTELTKKGLVLILLILTIKNGLICVMIGSVFISVISVFINGYYNYKLFKYKIKDQISDIIPSLVLSLIMGYVVYMLNDTGMSMPIELVAQIFVGFVVYVSLAKVFKFWQLTYILNKVRGFLPG